MATQKGAAPHRVAVTMAPNKMKGMSANKFKNSLKTASWVRVRVRVRVRVKVRV